ncbi:MAG: dienelactone hydrolase family protein [Verrucomicrobia bacterium]|nr:dienelactone hydrolase family protein [Verrucomicrobiota bacterium]
MNRTSILVAGLALATLTATAQDWAKARLEKSPRHLEWVKIKHGKREVNSFIAFPEVKEKATAVVVIHEIFGLTDWVRGVADQLAEAGYIAIAPDLLSGTAPGGGGTAELGAGDAVRKAISSLPPDQITADLNAVVDYVAKLPACNGKVAVGGFCWGGGQTFRFATNNKNIKAGFAFYGTGPEKEEDISRIHGPIYGFYGGNDARVNATIPKSSELMKKAGKTYDPVTYEGAGHGFMRAGEDPSGNAANKKAREEAWKRWKELLKKI